MTTLPQVNTEKKLCPTCKSEANQISSGVLYDKLGCGICRETYRKHSAMGLAFLMFAEINIYDLQQKISSVLYHQVEIDLKITTKEGETVFASTKQL
ncbi:hypothetical protein [Candidatus Uabimicrobium amorphum]|uniref:Uncharacterized protein n=1 Tax=Uabimicrobium amorphum TaxID=2596890 RepID=A0A5S9IQ91_UABAM|nr:hypothetical protein [Candidatus Uabimicrobium amorphum]BBM84685.1 hypothetical protein UABAM_03046 [Candidatus Uabimicrobium amorphum]